MAIEAGDKQNLNKTTDSGNAKLQRALLVLASYFPSCFLLLLSQEVGDKLTIDAVKESAKEIFGTSLAAFVSCKFACKWFWISSAGSSLILFQFGFPHSKKPHFLKRC